MLLFSKFISYFLKYILKLQPLLNNWYVSIGFKFFGKCPAILSDLFFYVKVPSNYTFLEPQEHSYTEHLDFKIQCFAHSNSCLFCYAIFLYGN